MENGECEKEISAAILLYLPQCLQGVITEVINPFASECHISPFLRFSFGFYVIRWGDRHGKLDG